MTYLDKFKLEHPDIANDPMIFDEDIEEEYCTRIRYGFMKDGLCDNDCNRCWNSEVKEKDLKENKPKDLKRLNEIGVDVHKLIDEVAEKRDRSLSIWIGKDYITINVYPHPDPADKEEE